MNIQNAIKALEASNAANKAIINEELGKLEQAKRDAEAVVNTAKENKKVDNIEKYAKLLSMDTRSKD